MYTNSYGVKRKKKMLKSKHKSDYVFLSFMIIIDGREKDEERKKVNEKKILRNKRRKSSQMKICLFVAFYIYMR